MDTLPRLCLWRLFLVLTPRGFRRRVRDGRASGGDAWRKRRRLLQPDRRVLDATRRRDGRRRWRWRRGGGETAEASGAKDGARVPRTTAGECGAVIAVKSQVGKLATRGASLRISLY